METFLLKWPRIFSFCVIIMPLSTYAQHSELKKMESFSQFHPTGKFVYLDFRLSQTNLSRVELETNAASDVSIYKRIEFPVSYQGSLADGQYFPLNILQRLNKAQFHLTYTSVVRSPNSFKSYPYKISDNSLGAAWAAHLKMSNRQQTVNAILNIATSLYINRAQQR